MAAITAAAVVVAPAAVSRKVSLKARAAGKASASFASNGSKVEMMQVWQPFNNRKYETMSFLPQLTDAEIAKQVEYMVKSGWAPCIEFESAENAFVTRKLGTNAGPNYYDNRYWVMYKLPMFGCTDASQVLTEIANCKKEFPNSFVRVVAFDSVVQVQMASFIVVKPK